MSAEIRMLPAADPVVFEKPPLDEVVCQLRFNDILRIGEEAPTKIQERIRELYPVFGTEQGLQIGINSLQPMPVLAAGGTTWQFKTQDDSWTVSLTTNFIALKTTAYTHFPDFWSRLERLLSVFEEIYSPPFYTRVGLRYVNRMLQLREGDKPVEWARMLNERIAGEYADPDLIGLVAESKHHIVLAQPKGLVGWRYSRDVGDIDGKIAERFILDFDHFVVRQVEIREVPELLGEFNEALYRLFVWCLTREGYSALGPRGKTAVRVGGS